MEDVATQGTAKALTISQQSFAEELVNKFDVTSVQNVPLRVGLKLDEDEGT